MISVRSAWRSFGTYNIFASKMFQYLNKKYMKDAECAESKEISNFRSIFIFRFMVIFVLKSHQLLMNFYDNSKNENRKIDFSFVSAHSASFMYYWNFWRYGFGEKIVQKWSSFQERCAMLWKSFFSIWVFFLCDLYLVFEIWSILCKGDFSCIRWLMVAYIKIDDIQNLPYLKN